MVEYDKGWKIPDILATGQNGLFTARDDLVFDFTKNELTNKLKAFLDPKSSLESVRHQFFGDNKAGSLAGDSKNWSLERARNALKAVNIAEQIIPVLYRPFDTRFLAYTEELIDRSRKEVMRHLLDLPKNISLSTTRNLESGDFAHALASEHVSTNHTVSIKETNYVFPLWLNQSHGSPKLNISSKFLEQIATNLGVAILADNNDLPEGVSAEDVIAYIYAVLHAPTYRTRYAEYLKSDFPRIPLAAIEGKASFAAVWKALVPLGQALIDLHLLRKVPAKQQANFPIQGSGTVEKPRYTEPKGLTKGRVWINAEQYFDGVPPETWGFKVGGYQVCEKWLKDRKGRQLTLDDVEHYNKVVASLTQTRELMTQIDGVANGALWPKSD